MSKKIEMDREQIEAILPHRGEWLMLDRVVKMVMGQLKVEYHVPENPNWVSGHFPGEPIMPGVLLVEIGNQAFALLALLSSMKNKFESFTILDGGNFQINHLVKPGQDLVITVQFDHSQKVNKRERVGTYNIYLAEYHEGRLPICSGTVFGKLVPKRLFKLNK